MRLSYHQQETPGWAGRTVRRNGQGKGRVRLGGVAAIGGLGGPGGRPDPGEPHESATADATKLSNHASSSRNRMQTEDREAFR